MIRAFAFLLALPALLAAAPSIPSGSLAKGCGTARAMQEWIDGGTRSAPGGNVAARRLAASLRGRTLYTDHFAIHYSVNKSAHQVTLTAADSALTRLRDSLYTAFSSDASRRDSLLHARLDSLGAPHPAYVQKAAQYFERARAYYGDTLGMTVPDSNLSDYFGRPSLGRFSVDLLDITTIYPSYQETYGLTQRPPGGAYASPMLVENDFRYLTSQSSPALTPIIARNTDGSVIHDYSVEWDHGLAVTIAHEYYHAVQFKYTSHLLGQGYHAWYELSAVGMEERLAPQVNDYLQYLRHVVPHTGSVSLLDALSLENYGNGIFHIYLTHALGRDFDVAMWERLKNNTNKLPDALLTAFGSAARWDSLYSAYAAAIAISGRPGAGASPLAFSPDMALWPRPEFDSALAQPISQVTLQPLTFRFIRPTASGTTWASLPGLKGGWRVTENDGQYGATFLPDSILPVSQGALAVAVPNTSPTGVKVMKLARAASGISAYPNPAPLAAGSVGFSAPVAGTSATLAVVSESGRRVATLAPNASGTLWTWDLRDLAGRPVPPGAYYYSVPGQTPQTLLLLP